MHTHGTVPIPAEAGLDFTPNAETQEKHLTANSSQTLRLSFVITGCCYQFVSP